MPLKQVWVYICIQCSANGPLMDQRPPWDPRELTQGLPRSSPLHIYKGWRLSRNGNHMCTDCANYYDGIWP